ncbi:hypothetical protein GYA19_01590 [Candidatus Beckwithbacteria bacterium]|nr:hypothetical protein [Candidatus Beckwithbacteria bacterium]
MRTTAQIILILILLFSLSSVFIKNIYADSLLEEFQDILSTSVPDYKEVGHIVKFTLPVDYEPIRSTDYITINLPNFTDITTNNLIVEESLGTVSVATDSGKVILTGISIQPGTNVTIRGITATNPTSSQYFNVNVTVSEDKDGLIIKYFANTTAAESSLLVTVSASIIPDTASLTISGYTSPYAFVFFSENGTIVGTVTANEDGYFAKYLNGLNGGTHSFRIYGIDNVSRTTSSVDLEVETPVYQHINVSNLILSPTIELNDNEIEQGDNVVVSGKSVPESNISLFTESPLRTYYTTSDINGNWAYTITDTNEYIVGDYKVYSLVQKDAFQSLFSNTLIFTVASDTGSSGNPSCDISHGDLNCDNITNLIDFSILMYYWGTNNALADMNTDRIVNLIDFSIMMYYWGK